MTAARLQGRVLDVSGAALVAVQLIGAGLLIPRGDRLAWPDGTPMHMACCADGS